MNVLGHYHFGVTDVEVVLYARQRVWARGRAAAITFAPIFRNVLFYAIVC